jgi:hypothetical protein
MAWWASVVFWSVVAPASIAQEPLRLGAEFQVNTYTTSRQQYPAVAGDTAGNFVVVWNSLGEDGSNRGAFGRRFSASGVPLGAAFQVNSYTMGAQFFPQVSRENDGDFVAVWDSPRDGAERDIFAQRFSSTGAPVAAEFQVNAQTSGLQYLPRIDHDAAGGFVVVWYGPDADGNGVFGRRFNAAGAAVGDDFQVNVYTIFTQYLPDLAVEGDGDFVVVWQSDNQDGFNKGVFARRFTSAGVAGVETQVNTVTVNDQRYPNVAIDGDGEYVVVWQDTNTGAAFGQRFNVLGAPVGGEFRVAVSTMTVQARPVIDMAATGGFVVAWGSFPEDDDTSYSVFARHFDALGTPRGAEFRVNSFTPGHQQRPNVALDGDGDFVIAWHSADQDGDSEGIFAQRFTTFAVLDIDGNGDVAPLTDGLLALRFMFGFTGPTLTAGAVGNGCTRCNAAAIEPYLAGLV